MQESHNENGTTINARPINGISTNNKITDLVGTEASRRVRERTTYQLVTTCMCNHKTLIRSPSAPGDSSQQSDD